MTQTVQLKRSSVASKVPTTSDLALGEIAINTHDGKLFIKKDNGTASIVTVATVDDTQTLTNKTLSSATLTGSLTANGSTGSAGQVLTSNSSGVYWSSVSSGGLTASSYVCIGILSADQSITAGSDVVVNFVDYADPQNWWDPTGKKFQPNVAGYYEITFAAWWATGSVSTGQINSQMRKNGNSFGIAMDPLNTSAGQSQILTRTIYLNGTTDYVDFSVYSGNSTTLNIQKGTADGSGTYFSAFLIASGNSGTYTNLTLSSNGSTATVISDTGSDATITAANATNAGVLTAEAQTIAGTKTFSSTISGSINGNANTATALQTARNINGTSFDGTANITVTASTPNAVTFSSSGLGGSTGTTFDGGSAVTISYNTIGASPLVGSSSLTTTGVITSGTWNGSAISGTYGGTGVNNGTNTITVGGNISTANSFTTSGNYALTLTQTAATSVTLPTTGTLATLAGTETLTNKILQSRVATISTATSITMNGDTTDIAIMDNTEATGTFTVNAPSGTPFNGQKLMLRLKSTNVQTFSWNAIFVGSVDSALPTASSGSSYTDYMGFVYNSTSSKWQLVAKNFGF